MLTTGWTKTFQATAQSRQSAKLFLTSSELGLHQTLTPRRMSPTPVLGGGAHSVAREGLLESQFRRGDIHCGTLYIRTLWATVSFKGVSCINGHRSPAKCTVFRWAAHLGTSFRRCPHRSLLSNAAGWRDWTAAAAAAAVAVVKIPADLISLERDAAASCSCWSPLATAGWGWNSRRFQLQRCGDGRRRCYHRWATAVSEEGHYPRCCEKAGMEDSWDFDLWAGRGGNWCCYPASGAPEAKQRSPDDWEAVGFRTRSQSPRGRGRGRSRWWRGRGRWSPTPRPRSWSRHIRWECAAGCGYTPRNASGCPPGKRTDNRIIPN